MPETVIASEPSFAVGDVATPKRRPRLAPSARRAGPRRLRAALVLDAVSHKLQVFLLLAGLLAAGSAHALDPSHHVNEYTVTAWTMEDGLPHNLVHAVAQDADGYLWVGSWEGAARFNGRQFTAFDQRTLADIPLLGVRTILRDDDGAMLFGTAQHGVIRLADGVWSKLEPTVERRLRVISLRRVPDGSLWIGTDQAPLRLWPDGRLETIGAGAIPRGVVFTLLEAGPGDMLIGSEHGLFRLHAGQIENRGRQLGLDASAVRAIIRRRNGDLVIGGDAGAFVLAGDGPLRQILDQRVESLLEDRDQTLWIGVSSGGLVRWHQGRIERIDAPLGLRGRNSQALIEDREGLLWVGTTNGLYRINDAPAFGLDTTRGLGDNYPRTILRHNDSMYVGHARGLDRWHGDTFEPVALGPDEVSVLALASARQGGLWIGTYDRGVLFLPDGASAASEAIAEPLPSRHVRAVYETADGSLWIGTTAGLVRRRPDGRLQRFDDQPGLNGSFVRGISPARDGGLWIALADGLMRWRPDQSLRRWTSGVDFPGIGAFDVLETGDGDAFIGTDHGLARLRAGRFTLYDRDSGLPNDTIFRVLQDRQGAIWLGSNRGAFRIEPEQFDELDAGVRQKLSVDTVDRASGMPSSQCNGGSGPAGDFDAAGRLWLPTSLGVAVIDPIATAARGRVPVPIRIEAVRADAKTLPIDQPLSLAASVNRVVVHYVSLHLRDPLGVQYRYRMLGSDRDWIEAGNDIEAIYTNLPPGLLRFEVQAAMAPVDWDGARKIPTATLELKRIPPFWRRLWFYATLPLGLLAVVLTWFFWQAMRSRQRQRELARLVEDRTRELRGKNAALQQAGREREALLQQLAFQASHDALTGLPNRRAGETRLGEAVREAAASGSPLSVALLDIDHFKQINDQHGHEVGDIMLRHVATVLAQRGCAKPEDLARYGGEEFLLLLPDQPLDQATRHLQALASYIATSTVELPDGSRLACSASIGVTQWQPGLTPSQVVVQADRRLYQAKAQGRNRVVGVDRRRSKLP